MNDFDLETEITLYPARQRGHLISEGFSALCTFNFAEYQQESREPLGSLSVFNEGILGIGAEYTLSATEQADIFLMPIAGGLEIRGEGLKDGPVYVIAGQVLHMQSRIGSEYIVANPYPENVVNFLQFNVLNEVPGDLNPAIQLYDFGLDRTHTLLPFFEHRDKNFRVSFGRYKAKEGATYKGVGAHHFLFVIEGALEVEGRLLHSGDAIAFTPSEQMEYEALSEEAVFLLLETD